jgi:hypothetical protein
VAPNSFGKLRIEPEQGYIVVQAQSATMTKGILYPSKSPYTPCVFKPYGVILQESKEGCQKSNKYGDVPNLHFNLLSQRHLLVMGILRQRLLENFNNRWTEPWENSSPLDKRYQFRLEDCLE